MQHDSGGPLHRICCHDRDIQIKHACPTFAEQTVRGPKEIFGASQSLYCYCCGYYRSLWITTRSLWHHFFKEAGAADELPPRALAMQFLYESIDLNGW